MLTYSLARVITYNFLSANMTAGTDFFFSDLIVMKNL